MEKERNDINKKVEERLRLSKLIANKRIGIITSEEEKELTQMVTDNHLSELYDELMRQPEAPEDFLTDREIDFYWKEFKKKHPELNTKHRKAPKYPHYLKYTIGAAAVAAAIVFGISFFIGKPIHIKKEAATVHSNTIAHTNLDEYIAHNPVVYQACYDTTKREDISIFHFSPIITNKNSLITETIIPAHNYANFMTSDSSWIALNQCSNLRYPNKFDDQIREVWLNGEAYFHVKHEEKRTFLVHAGDITVCVLGTEFNVCAYPDTPIKVTLISGSIKVETPKERILVQPGETATYSGKQLCLSKENEKEIMAWTNNRFYFNNGKMKDLALILSRWFGTKIKCQDEETEQSIVSLDIKRTFPLLVTLQRIESLNDDFPIYFKSSEEGIIAYKTEKSAYYGAPNPPERNKVITDDDQ